MFPEITLSGTAYERGQHYGAQTAPLIRHSIASYARLFAYRRGVDWAAICEQAGAFMPVLREHAPDLLEEMRGIADGSGESFAAILALNARTELLNVPRTGTAHPEYDTAMARNRAASVPDHGECTTVAALPAATGGPTILAQNWDWTGDQRAACVVLRIHQPGLPDVLTLTEAGIVAKIGLNSAGVAVNLNILSSRNDGQHPGVPVHVLLRLALHQRSAAAARAMIERSPAGASSCISLADAGGHVVAMEITPDGTAAIEPVDGILVHTNHCVATSTQACETPIDPISSTVPRYSRAETLLRAEYGHIGTETVAAILRDHDGGVNAICRHPSAALHPSDRVESVCGVILDVSARTMYLAPDIPCQSEFITLEI